MEQDERFLKVVEFLKRLPGIGEKQAKRITYSIIERGATNITSFAKSLHSLSEISNQCVLCGMFFGKEDVNKDTCSICNDKNRNNSIIMLVAHLSDVYKFEKIGAYNGLYIITGIIPIDRQTTYENIVKERFIKFISSRKEIKEIIFGYAATSDGDYTSHVLKLLIKEKFGGSIKISSLGRGLSTGMEIEYSDTETIESALKGRKELD